MRKVSRGQTTPCGRNIAAIWGLMGEADDILASYLDGQVFSGMGPCPRRDRRRRMRRRGNP